ncbi:hypothetical protein AC578_3339 [Pseudocercospora eumusae]|uniref:Secreted protein n=1 Tax=Pseudocercospora eumusae TaxID=321146 RepID=A0A139HD78_9PEZI|nr:hypothetical protein AC578_3339 [Pseudocercospora eumusae]
MQTLITVAVFLYACCGVSAGVLNTRDSSGCKKGEYSTVCSSDAKKAIFCYASGQTADLQDCPKADCQLDNNGDAVCGDSAPTTLKQPHGRHYGIGPHQCSEVQDYDDGAYVCSQQYDQLSG